VDRKASDGRTRRGATGLALFSLGLGSAQVGAPGAVARLIGADDSPTTRLITRWACGVRELAAGLGVGYRPSAHPGIVVRHHLTPSRGTNPARLGEGLHAVVMRTVS